MFTLSHNCKSSIIEYMIKQCPNEGCGIIAHSLIESQYEQVFYPIRNSHKNPKHFFQFNELDWINVNYHLLTKKASIACYVHSHINGPTHLSEEDIAHITDFSAIQIIVDITERDSIHLHAYQFNDKSGRFEHCPLMFA